MESNLKDKLYALSLEESYGGHNDKYMEGARALMTDFASIIDDTFQYWVGPVPGETAMFTDMSFTMEEMRFVCLNLTEWVAKYGSLLAVRAQILDWWDYTTETGEVRTISLFAWMCGKRPDDEGGKNITTK